MFCHGTGSLRCDLHPSRAFPTPREDVATVVAVVFMRVPSLSFILTSRFCPISGARSPVRVDGNNSPGTPVSTQCIRILEERTPEVFLKCSSFRLRTATARPSLLAEAGSYPAIANSSIRSSPGGGLGINEEWGQDYCGPGFEVIGDFGSRIFCHLKTNCLINYIHNCIEVLYGPEKNNFIGIGVLIVVVFGLLRLLSHRYLLCRSLQNYTFCILV